MGRHKQTGIRLRAETQLLRDVQEEFSHGDTRLFRNTVGSGYVGPHVSPGDGSIIITKPSRVTFGLGVGTSDLIGWQAVTITPDMVGRTFAQFVAAEGKAANGKTTPEQEAFIAIVRKAGGLAGVFRSEHELRRILMGVNEE
jgi:hypothetical protein